MEIPVCPKCRGEHSPQKAPGGKLVFPCVEWRAYVKTLKHALLREEHKKARRKNRRNRIK